MVKSNVYVNTLMWKSISEIRGEIKKMRQEYFNLQRKNKLWSLKEFHLIKQARRNVARAKTSLSLKLKQTNGNNK